jgi:hypothetical protein
VALFVLAHIPRTDLPELLSRVVTWLRPKGWFLATMGSRGTGERVEADWLGVPMYFSGLGAGESRRLVRSVGLEIVEDEVVVQHEPDHGEVEFLWILARKEQRETQTAWGRAAAGYGEASPRQRSTLRWYVAFNSTEDQGKHPSRRRGRLLSQVRWEGRP